MIELKPIGTYEYKQMLKFRNSQELRDLSVNGNIITEYEHNRFIADFKDYIQSVFVDSLYAGYIWVNGDVLSIALKPDYRGKGIGKTALKMFIDKYNLPRYSALVKSDNIASQRLFESLGFEKVSIANNTYYYERHA